MRPQVKLSTYDIHPISVKLIQKGHPWVTKDKFSEKFHPRDKFVVALNRKKPFALLLNDPEHSTVRARVWSKGGSFAKQIMNFRKDLTQRMSDAFKKRVNLKINEQRQNFYLVFGEADKLPGLFITYLNGQILIQYYSNFWKRYQDNIVSTIIALLDEHYEIFITRSQMWVQDRSHDEKGQKKAQSLDPNISNYEFEVKEFGVRYLIKMGLTYDFGIYTDMASIRDAMKDEFQDSDVLNLYAYTGAFSLFALKQGAKSVDSVDLSPNYTDWLDENLYINNDVIEEDKHQIFCESVQSFLNKKTEKKYDLIICDPPSSSSDGKTKTNALREYEKQIAKFNEMINEDGKIVLFLNTHKVSFGKFLRRIQQIIDRLEENPLKITTRYGLNQDCPQLNGFPEGSYLKGVTLERMTNDDIKAKEEKNKQKEQERKEFKEKQDKDVAQTSKAHSDENSSDSEASVQVSSAQSEEKTEEVKVKVEHKQEAKVEEKPKAKAKKASTTKEPTQERKESKAPSVKKKVAKKKVAKKKVAKKKVAKKSPLKAASKTKATKETPPQSEQEVLDKE